MPPRQASSARRTKGKPLGPRKALAAEAARLAKELLQKQLSREPRDPSVPLEEFDEASGWFDPPPKQETPRQTSTRFMRMPRWVASFKTRLDLPHVSTVRPSSDIRYIRVLDSR